MSARRRYVFVRWSSARSRSRRRSSPRVARRATTRSQSSARRRTRCSSCSPTRTSAKPLPFENLQCQGEGVSRRRAAAVIVVVGCAIAAPALTQATAARDGYVAAPASCGTARWPVKTLADAAAASLDTKPKGATVISLSALKAPPHIGNELSRQAGFGGTEFRVFKETVRLTGWKTEDDSDIHVAVQALAGPQTMVIEFPLAGCIAKSASATARARMAGAKAALLKACGGVAPGT